MFAEDFLAVASGEIAVEDLVGAGMRAWYPDRVGNSLVHFMLQYFDRQPAGALRS
jgi:hypothetical protein